MDGSLTPEHGAEVLIAWSERGETGSELATVVETLLSKAVHVPIPGGMDLCGIMSGGKEEEGKGAFPYLAAGHRLHEIEGVGLVHGQNSVIPASRGISEPFSSNATMHRGNAMPVSVVYPSLPSLDSSSWAGVCQPSCCSIVSVEPGCSSSKRFGFPDLWSEGGERRLFGDSHWNDAGALVGYREILKRLGLEQSQGRRACLRRQ